MGIMVAYNFGTFGPEHLGKIKKGIILYNKEMFWECHEELEGPWLEGRGDHARNVYWAVIQVAAALFHYIDDRYEGAVGMIVKAKNKFDECEKLNVETDLMEQYLSWTKFKGLVRGVPFSPKLQDFDELYGFKFIDPFEWVIEK